MSSTSRRFGLSPSMLSKTRALFRLGKLEDSKNSHIGRTSPIILVSILHIALHRLIRSKSCCGVYIQLKGANATRYQDFHSWLARPSFKLSTLHSFLVSCICFAALCWQLCRDNFRYPCDFDSGTLLRTFCDFLTGVSTFISWSTVKTCSTRQALQVKQKLEG
ncbi:hypothetical protein F5880DRAFT_81087 [Lentinula raphanica]|nr:hypothetical protein F5880DRAFT_81087 [Lentinula raphanica]